jgi:hypothetical protein
VSLHIYGINISYFILGQNGAIMSTEEVGAEGVATIQDPAATTIGIGMLRSDEADQKPAAEGGRIVRDQALLTIETGMY